jgi:xylulokinase
MDPAAMTHALGIDVGTTNVKAAIVGPDGTVHATASRNLVADVEGERAELDPEAQWDAVVAAVAECAHAAPDAARQVGAVGVDSQYSSIVPVRADGTPVAPMRLWSDRRGTDRSFAILAQHEESFLGFIERHGIPPVGGGLSPGTSSTCSTTAPPSTPRPPRTSSRWTT